MPRKKLHKFQQITTDPLVVEEIDPKSKKIKGKWHNHIFGNTNPITLEIGCGYGEYTINLAEMFRLKCFQKKIF